MAARVFRILCLISILALAMVKGAPDHHKGVALYAWDGEELILIKVDPSGQLYALLMGDYDGTPTA
ncbi:MAG: hypothetical protein HWN68_21175, partial [Desulfobacterales bacterium]|nr:hypothetical protein [Desulfobacterales bacterium]